MIKAAVENLSLDFFLAIKEKTIPNMKNIGDNKVEEKIILANPAIANTNAVNDNPDISAMFTSFLYLI
ncbi:MAG: hypothetical protein WC438_04960 [Candidatus Pacearchaeota archaeon]